MQFVICKFWNPYDWVRTNPFVTCDSCAGHNFSSRSHDLQLQKAGWSEQTTLPGTTSYDRHRTDNH